MKRHIVRRAANSGFTLLEVLVTLALSMVLMSAIYAGLNLYWRFSVAGQSEIERMQIARAVLRKIELDLRSVVYHMPPASDVQQTSGTSSQSSSGSSSSRSSGSSSGGSGSGGSSPSGSGSASSSGSSSTQTAATQTTTPEDAVTSTTSGLYGNQTTLMIHISKPRRELALIPGLDGQNAQTRVSDMLTVAYFISGQGTEPLQNLVGIPGFARMQGDQMAMTLADQQTNTAALAAQTEILAPEIVAVRFEYFDGLQWRSDWDSAVLGGLPRAVEVVIELAPPPVTTGVAAKRPVDPSSLMYRLVVALPLGKPIDTSAVQP